MDWYGGPTVLEHLETEGADLLVSDIVPDRATEMAQRFHARVVGTADVYDAECDVFSPNAAGGDAFSMLGKDRFG